MSFNGPPAPAGGGGGGGGRPGRLLWPPPPSSPLLLLLLLLLLPPASPVDVCLSSGDKRSSPAKASPAERRPPATDFCHLLSPPCFTEEDKYSLEALRTIHKQMDDDKDGGIEVEESDEFIREDMKYKDASNKHSNLHREDKHITIEDLWKRWKTSEVHNWTQEETLQWLVEFVELPQYEKNFRENNVKGTTLPRIAVNEPAFIISQLKIIDRSHRQKLHLKALDVVLFGPLTQLSQESEKEETPAGSERVNTQECTTDLFTAQSTWRELADEISALEKKLAILRERAKEKAQEKQAEVDVLPPRVTCQKKK